MHWTFGQVSLGWFCKSPILSPKLMFSIIFLALRVATWCGHWSSVADLYINRCAVQPSRDSESLSLRSKNSV